MRAKILNFFILFLCSTCICGCGNKAAISNSNKNVTSEEESFKADVNEENTAIEETASLEEAEVAYEAEVVDEAATTSYSLNEEGAEIETEEVETEEKSTEVEEEPATVIGEIAVGNYVYFGHYEQDNDLENGPETIEWYVSSCDGNTATLVSTKILDAMTFADSIKTTYETSKVYAWLHGDLLADFTASEVNSISDVRIASKPNDVFYGSRLTSYASAHYEWMVNDPGHICWVNELFDGGAYTHVGMIWMTDGFWCTASGYGINPDSSSRGVQPIITITY